LESNPEQEELDSMGVGSSAPIDLQDPERKELYKRLDECHRLQNTALDLSGLKMGPTDAIKVAAFLPKWCVKAVISPKKNTVHAM
jgi:hypothetical protein